MGTENDVKVYGSFGEEMLQGHSETTVESILFNKNGW